MTRSDVDVYRSDAVARQERLSWLLAEERRLLAETARLQGAIGTERATIARARWRLAEAGPGQGWGDPRRDRVDQAALLLAGIGLAVSVLHLIWHRYIHTDRTVIPVLLWLATPGILAALIAWPHRRQSVRCLLALLAGAVVTLLPLLNLALAWRGW